MRALASDDWASISTVHNRPPTCEDAPLSQAFAVGPPLCLAPKRREFNVPGGQLAHTLAKARAVLLRHNWQQRHREGLHDGAGGVDPQRVDDRKFPLILEHLACVRCGIAIQPPPPLEQGLESERSLPVKLDGGGLSAPLEEALDVGALGHEVKEKLARGLVALLHFLIGLIGQLYLGFGRLVQLRLSLGSHQLPVEETIQKWHLRDQQAPHQAFTLLPGLERQLARRNPQLEVPPAPDRAGIRDAEGVAHGEDRDIRPAIFQVEGRNLVIEKGQGDLRLPHDRWLMFFHGVGPPVLVRLFGFYVRHEQVFHPIVAVSPVLCKSGRSLADIWR